MSSFVLRLGPYVSEATEQRTLALRLVNRGDRTCVLYGYPRVSLYDARGVIPFVIRHGGDQMISAREPRPVVLRPGRAAFLLLNKNQCVRGVTAVTRATTMLKIGIRDAPTAEVASFRFPPRMPLPWRIPDYCGKGDPGSIITLSPFVPTVRAALNG